LRCALVRGPGQFTYFQILLANTRPGSLEQGLLDLQPPLWAGPAMLNLSGLVQRFFNNLIFYLLALAHQPANSRGACIFLLLLIFAIPGMIVSLRKSLVLGFYGMLNLLLILVWPFQDARFLSPLTGIIGFWILEGLGFFRDKLKARRGLGLCLSGLAYVLLLAALLGFVRSDFQIWRQTRRQAFPAVYRVSKYFEVVPFTRERARFCSALFFIREHLPPDAVVASVSPHLISLIADRQAAFFPATRNVGEFWSYFEANRVNYLLHDEIFRELGGVNLMTPEFLEPALSHSPFPLQTLWAAPASQTFIRSVNYPPP